MVLAKIVTRLRVLQHTEGASSRTRARAPCITDAEKLKETPVGDRSMRWAHGSII